MPGQWAPAGPWGDRPGGESANPDVVPPRAAAPVSLPNPAPSHAAEEEDEGGEADEAEAQGTVERQAPGKRNARGRRPNRDERLARWRRAQEQDARRSKVPREMPGWRPPEPLKLEGRYRPTGDPLTDTDLRLARLLPVPSPSGGGGAGRQATINVVSLVLAALMVAAVGLVALTRGRGTDPAARGSAAPAASAAPLVAVAGGAPTDVRLRDERSQVALEWTNPPGAAVPIQLSVGRGGEPPRSNQRLAAGTASYVFFTLNPDEDYCFTVSALHRDRAETSEPVCTRRS